MLRKDGARAGRAVEAAQAPAAPSGGARWQAARVRTGARGRLRADQAGEREDRVLPHACGAVERADTDRANEFSLVAIAASQGDLAGRAITVGGAERAGEAIARRPRSDECHLFLTPVAVAGGKRAPPALFAWLERARAPLPRGARAGRAVRRRTRVGRAVKRP